MRFNLGVECAQLSTGMPCTRPGSLILTAMLAEMQSVIGLPRGEDPAIAQLERCALRKPFEALFQTTFSWIAFTQSNLTPVAEFAFVESHNG